MSLVNWIVVSRYKFGSGVLDHVVHVVARGVRAGRHRGPHRVRTLVIDDDRADGELLLEFGACLRQRLLHRDLLQLALFDDRPRQLHLRLDTNCVHRLQAT